MHKNQREEATIAIIGAGIAGLSCATRLKALGFQVQLYEKSYGVSGRMSTRKTENWSGDHGAQYFTARDPLFIDQVNEWIDSDVAAIWNPRLKVFKENQWQDSAPTENRYVGTPAMNSPGKHLTKTLPIEFNQTIEAFGIDANMQGCWTVIANFRDQLNLPFDAAFINDEIISWISRNNSKPRRTGIETWIIHANPTWSQEWIELDKDQAAQLILNCAKGLGLDCEKAKITIHRWRYASGHTTQILGYRLREDLKLGFCGDWLNGGRVEGAWLSGYQLACQIDSTNK